MAKIRRTGYTRLVEEGVIYFAIALIVAAVIGVNIYLTAKRRREIKEEAERLGFVFLSEHALGSAARLPHPLFDRG